MNTLDKDRLDFLIRSLTEAKKYGFSSLSSPMEILFESGTDLLLVLAQNLEQGKQALPLNPELKFSEFQQDSLGNPKQIKIQKLNPIYFDPEAAKYLRQIASLLVALKNRQSLPNALKASGLVVERQSTKKAELELSATASLKEKNATLFLKMKKQNAYYRRQRNKERTIQ